MRNKRYSAFYIGIFDGVHMDLLDTSYLDAGIKGFEWLCREALEENGKLEWVQAVAWGPGEIRREREMIRSRDISAYFEGIVRHVTLN